MPWFRAKHGKIVERLGDEPPGPSIDPHESYTWASDQNVRDFGEPAYSMSHVYGEEPSAHCGACEVDEGMHKHGK